MSDIKQSPRMSRSWRGQPSWLLSFPGVQHPPSCLVDLQLRGHGRTGHFLAVLAGAVCLCVGLDHWSGRTPSLGSRLPVCPQYLLTTCSSRRTAVTQGWEQGLLLVQSAVKVALWRIFKLGFWTIEKIGLIKEYLKRDEGISRNNAYDFSLKHNLRLS